MTMDFAYFGNAFFNAGIRNNDFDKLPTFPAHLGAIDRLMRNTTILVDIL